MADSSGMFGMDDALAGKKKGRAFGSNDLW